MLRAAAWELFFINHFYILYPFNHEGNRGLFSIMVLNQDLQDLEDFYQLGVGWDSACRSMKFK
jgi:hypothetical protein